MKFSSLFSRLWQQLRREKSGSTLVLKVGVFLENALKEPSANRFVSELKKMGPAVVQKARERIIQGSVLRVVNSPDQIYQLRLELIQANEAVRVGWLLREDQFFSKRRLIYDGLNEDWSDKFSGGYQWNDEIASVLCVLAGVELLCLIYIMELVEGKLGKTHLSSYMEESEALFRKIFELYIDVQRKGEIPELDVDAARMSVLLQMQEARDKFLQLQEPNARFLGDFLVYQLLSDHFNLDNDTFVSFVNELPEDLRAMTQAWILIYLSWLFKAAIVEKYGRRVAEVMTKQVDQRLQKAESVEARLVGVGNTIQFWFTQLDNATEHVGTEVRGHEVPFEVFAAMTFLVLDEGSPHYKRTNIEEGVQFDVATALAKGKEAALDFIQGVVGKSVEVQSWLKDEANN